MANDILERIRNRIDVFAKQECKTEFDEMGFDHAKIATVWAEIVPKNGREENVNGNSVRENITHKITTRINAIKEPRNDMYFEYKGQRFEVLYFMPHYKRNDLIEFYCKLVIETEEDYSNGKSEKFDREDNS